MTARFYRLSEMHQRIDDRLRAELKRRAPDHMHITRLKKMKLRVKDMMRRLVPQPSFG